MTNQYPPAPAPLAADPDRAGRCSWRRLGRAWYYGAGVAENTIAGWKAREAQAGRVYTCATQTIGGFPFGIEVRCADAGAS